jgi:hypothetical protein
MQSVSATHPIRTFSGYTHKKDISLNVNKASVGGRYTHYKDNLNATEVNDS